MPPEPRACRGFSASADPTSRGCGDVDEAVGHRISLTRHNLPAVMGGDLDDVINACRTFFQAEALKAEQVRPT